MGEVYRARDTRLQRMVAVKVLPDALARDPERIARLRREATTLAALNDPNIAAIFGFEDADGRHALVLELVEGPTLAERLARGALPIGESLAIARQIARALDAAHRQGVVHRDLKPANVKVRDDGTVKVLDFGLAKALDETAGGDPSGSAAPTITSPALLTGVGVILGTAAYMSPEQARGAAADKRSDIWAFGCVLYEMLTAHRAFAGPGVTETFAAVLRGEPDWSLVPSGLPPPTRTLLERCLEKERTARVQDMAAVRFVLDEQASFTTAAVGTAPALKTRRAGTAGWIAMAAVAGIAAGGFAVAFLQPRAQTATRTGRFELAPSKTDSFSAAVPGANIAIAPDGSRIVYSAMRDGVYELVTRPLDRLESTPIAGTEGGVDPFFSPDGRQIGFFATGELKRVAIEGGAAVTIWQGNPTFEGASWSADTIFFSHDTALYRVSAAGGTPEQIAAPDAAHGETGYDRPVLLPGSDAILYTIELSNGHNRIAARRPGSGGATLVVEDGYGPQYLPSGHLVYAQGNRLMAIVFNPVTLETSGAPIEIEQNLFTKSADSVSNVAVAADGTALFVSGSNPGVFGRAVWVDRSGAHVARAVDLPLQQPRNVRLSPDGRRMALTTGASGHGDIWIYDVGGSAQPVKLTFHDHNTFPIWSRDGRQIFYLSVAGTSTRLLSIPSDGSALEPKPVMAENRPAAPLDVTADGVTVLVYGDTGVWLVRTAEKTIRRWLESPFAQYNARLSPDGRWLAYTSTQSGAADIWLRPFPGPGAPTRVSSSGGHDPVWSHDGKEIFFINGTKMMAARVSLSDPTPTVEPSRQLFEGGFLSNSVDLVLRFFDVAADGRFLMFEPVDPRSSSIVVAQHWDAEIASRRPK